MPIDTRYMMNRFRVNNVSDNCPACNRPEYDFGNGIVTLPYVQEPESRTKASGIQAVPIICRHCGYIRLFFDKEE